MAMFFAYDEKGLEGKAFNLDHVISFSFNLANDGYPWARVAVNSGNERGPLLIDLYGEDVKRLKNFICSSCWANEAFKDEPAQKP